MAAQPTPLTERKYVLPFVLITSLFFLWAFGVNLNDILIPHLKAAFGLTDFQSSFIQVAFFGGYFLAAFPAGWAMERIGYKKGILLGLFLCAGGAVLCVAVALVLFALKDSIVFFNSPTDVVEKHVAAGTRIRLGGLAGQHEISTFAPAFERVREAAYGALRRYQPRYYSGQVKFIRAAEVTQFPANPKVVWSHRVGNIDVETVPGDHLGMLTIHHEKLASVLNSYLAAGSISA